MRYFITKVGSVLLILVSTSLCSGQETPKPTGKGVEQRHTELRQKFLAAQSREYMIRIESTDKEIPLRPEAILNYSNPLNERGSTHGSTFLWLAGKQPVAIGSFSIRRPKETAHCEFSSLSENELTCSRDGNFLWTPKTRQSPLKPIPNVQAPASGEKQRFVQMRFLARKFSAFGTKHRTGERYELRLLPQPLYRYADQDQGVIDGALFAFVVSNDPELILQLEAVASSKSGSPRWTYSFARMTSQKTEAFFNKKPVWEVINHYIEGRDPEKSYYEGGIGRYEEEAKESR